MTKIEEQAAIMQKMQASWQAAIDFGTNHVLGLPEEVRVSFIAFMDILKAHVDKELAALQKLEKEGTET